MSVPDNSRPKAPPSLLADAPARPAGAPASGTPNGSRILANLEGRVVPPVPPAGKTQRSSKAAGLVALLVIGAGAFGAWHWMSRTPSGTSNASSVAATAASAANVVVTSAVPASPAVVASAQKNAPEEASAPHAATIVADDDAANVKASDSDRLSRALADGSASGAAASAAPVVAAVVPVAQQAQAPEKSTAKHKSAAEAKQEKQERQEKANAHKGDSKTAVAQAKQAHANGKRDDSDVDLLAVLVARTKPADAKQSGGTHGSKSAAKATDGNASLAQQVKACSERGFFEDQLCRWRVCDGHWGKDPACPQAAKASTEH